MGHFTGVATRVVVGDTDSPAGEFFDALYCGDSDAVKAFDLLDIGVVLRGDKTKFVASIYNDSAYFDAWDWQEVEQKKAGTLYSSRASIRFNCPEVFVAIFNHFKDDLVVAEGDIVYREIYESGQTETVIAFVNGEFIVRDGFTWEGGEEHDDHPSNKDAVEGQSWAQYLAWEETWFPGWNLNLLPT